MQLVLSGKNIIGHGEGFLAMGGTVINPDTGAVYQNSTIVECENCPADIGKVGYEYHAGQFVPCGPFGEGDGNLAVWCNDCKAPKDSGFKLSDVAKVFYCNYEGKGEFSCSVTCGFRPKQIIISGYNTYGDACTFCVMSTDNGNANGAYGHGQTLQTAKTPNSNSGIIGTVKCTPNDTGATWEYYGGTSGNKEIIAMNAKPSSGKWLYSLIAFG